MEACWVTIRLPKSGDRHRSRSIPLAMMRRCAWAGESLADWSLGQGGQKQTFGAEANVPAIWKDRIAYHTQVTAANPDLLYVFARLDLLFRAGVPQYPKGNWIKTVPGRGLLGCLRLHTPTQAYFDNSWAMPDFEKIK